MLWRDQHIDWEDEMVPEAQTVLLPLLMMISVKTRLMERLTERKCVCLA
jgi:uncharacterized membrane protein